MSNIISDFNKIEVLVNNAGVGFVGAIKVTWIAEIKNVFDSNFLGTLKLTQSVLAHILKENTHFSNIISQRN